MLTAHMQSRRVTLQPATPADGMTFYGTLIATGVESVPSLTDAMKLGGSAAMFLVTKRTTGEVIGFSTLHGADQAGRLKCGVFLGDARFGIGWEALLLTINYGFAMFPITVMIVETTEASFQRFGLPSDGGSDDEKQAVLENHVYFRGRYFDLHSYVIERREWELGVRYGYYDVQSALAPRGAQAEEAS